MRPTIAKVWTFGSSSSPDKTYETIQYTDTSLSCDCPGWTRRVDARGQRSCKHTRWVDQGLAERNALSSKSYIAAPVAAPGGRRLILTGEDV